MGKLDELFRNTRPYLPFTPPNVAWRIRNDMVQSILDVGCGSGEPMRFFKRCGKFFAVGADVFLPYLKRCKAKRSHDQYVLCDVRRLPFKKCSFDLILCLEVLEHLDKEAGSRLVADLEGVARRQVVISTPVGEQRQEPYDHNPHQQHRSGWKSDEFKRLGFTVRGLGFPPVNGLRITDFLPQSLNVLGHMIWIFSGPFVYFFPEFGGSIVCSKSFDPPNWQPKGRGFTRKK